MQAVASFHHLYREHYAFVWATVRRFGVVPMLAEDAVHDTFIVAYRRRDTFDGRSPRAWLYSIGRRVASNYRRTQVRRDARHATAAEFEPSFGMDVEATVLARSTLDRFLDTLSPADRELFVLSEVDGLTGPELAATLGRKLPTLYSRVRILRRRFEASIDDASLEAARRERPSATVQGWMLLQPWLAAPAVGSAAVLGGAIAVAVAVVGTVSVVGWPGAQESPAPTRAAAQVSTPDPPPRQAAPDPRPPAPAPAPAAERPSPAPAERPSPSRAPRAEVPDLAADTRLLQDINRALQGGRPGEALALLERHATTFPEPAQPDLRTALWVTALCDLDRPEQARQRAQALLRTRPGTPVARRIEQTCVGSLQPQQPQFAQPPSPRSP